MRRTESKTKGNMKMNIRRSSTIESQKGRVKMLPIPTINLVSPPNSAKLKYNKERVDALRPPPLQILSERQSISTNNPSYSMGNLQYQRPIQSARSKPRSPSISSAVGDDVDYSFKAMAEHSSSNRLYKFMMERMKSQFYDDPAASQPIPNSLNKMTGIADLDSPGYQPTYKQIGTVSSVSDDMPKNLENILRKETLSSGAERSLFHSKQQSSVRSAKSLLLFSATTQEEDLNKRQRLRNTLSVVPSYILLPDDCFKEKWDVFIMLLLLFTALVTPFRIAYYDDDPLGWIITNTLVDFLFAVDIILNFFSAYFDSNEELVTDKRLIAKEYLRGWFIIDFVAILPLNYALGSTQDYTSLARLARLPRLYKLIKMAKLTRMLKIIREQNKLVKNMNDIFKVSASVERFVFFIFLLVLIFHITACFWYLIAKLEGIYPDSWVVHYSKQDSSILELYVFCLYWTVTTMTTIGYGDVSAHTTFERMFSILIMFFGVVAYSFIIGSLTSIISSLDSRTAKLKEKLDILNNIRSEYELSTDLYMRLRKNLKYDHSKNLMDKFGFLQELPSNLKLELSFTMHKEIIRAFPFFTGKPRSFVAYIGPLLRPIKILEGDYIYREGDPIGEIYFLIKGKAQMVLEKYKDTPYIIVEEGHHFGEMDMLFMSDNKRHFTAKAKTEVELLVLSREDLVRVSSEFNDIMTNFFMRAEARLKRALQEKKEAIGKCIRHQMVRPHVTRAFTIQRQSTFASDKSKRMHLSPYQAHKSIITEVSLSSDSEGEGSPEDHSSRGNKMHSNMDSSITEESSLEEEEVVNINSNRKEEAQEVRRMSTAQLMKDLTEKEKSQPKHSSFQKHSEGEKESPPIPDADANPTESDSEPNSSSSGRKTAQSFRAKLEAKRRSKIKLKYPNAESEAINSPQPLRSGEQRRGADDFSQAALQHNFGKWFVGETPRSHHLASDMFALKNKMSSMECTLGKLITSLDKLSKIPSPTKPPSKKKNLREMNKGKSEIIPDRVYSPLKEEISSKSRKNKNRVTLREAQSADVVGGKSSDALRPSISAFTPDHPSHLNSYYGLAKKGGGDNIQRMGLAIEKPLVSHRSMKSLEDLRPGNILGGTTIPQNIHSSSSNLPLHPNDDPNILNINIPMEMEVKKKNITSEQDISGEQEKFGCSGSNLFSNTLFSEEGLLHKEGPSLIDVIDQFNIPTTNFNDNTFGSIK